MKAALFAALLVLIPSLALAQGSEPPPIRNVGDAYAVVGRVVERLKHNRLQIPEFHVSVNDSKEINAYAQADLKQITIPIGIVRFLRADEGELAFVIAHEIGHIQDRQCHEIAEHARITQEGQSRLCEQRADALGSCMAVAQPCSILC